MSKTAIAPSVAATEESARARVRIEEDATPVVRLIGRTLRDSLGRGLAAGLTTTPGGVVVVRSHSTPQVATVNWTDGDVEVLGGASAAPDATVVVDLDARFAPLGGPEGDTERAEAVLRALAPPLPPWREAAQQFWTLTRDIPGIPDVLVVTAEDGKARERVELGEGPTRYLLSGSPDLLAGVLSGADDFLSAVAAGLGIQGSLSQMSVMTAASWRVRLDV